MVTIGDDKISDYLSKTGIQTHRDTNPTFSFAVDRPMFLMIAIGSEAGQSRSSPRYTLNCALHREHMM